MVARGKFLIFLFISGDLSGHSSDCDILQIRGGDHLDNHVATSTGGIFSHTMKKKVVNYSIEDALYTLQIHEIQCVAKIKSGCFFLAIIG